MARVVWGRGGYCGVVGKGVDGRQKGGEGGGDDEIT